MNSGQTRVQRSLQTTVKILGGAASLALLSFNGQRVLAQPASVLLPPETSEFYFQTNAPLRCANIGDWYTTQGTGTSPNCGPDFGGGEPTNNPQNNRLHRFFFSVTEADLANGSAQFVVEDAESAVGQDGNGNEPQDAIPDEVDGEFLTGGTPDPVRFRLYLMQETNAIITGDPTGQPEIAPSQGTNIIQGGPNGQRIVFTVTEPGTYMLTSETGALPIFGDPTEELNNDDNSYKLRVPSLVELNAGQFQGTIQQTSLAVSPLLEVFFLVGPPKTGEISTLSLRNFDLDNAGTVTYLYENPGGGVDTETGTVSGNATWNGGLNDLNNGEDLVPLSGRFGRWSIQLTDISRRNQGLVEVNIGPQNIPITVNPPNQAGNFTITPDTELNTQVDVPAVHEFTVENNFFTNDIVNLELGGTAANFEVTLINVATGEALTDTDGDGVVDTGILSPEETLTFALQVTPTNADLLTDTTIITGTSFMDAQVRAQTGNGQPVPQSVEKITNIVDFSITPDTELFTTVGVPARHDFEVTSIAAPGTDPQTINLEPSGTDPNYTTQIVNRATGDVLVDTNNDGIIDTGPLAPNQTLELTFLATPQAGTTTSDTTVITGTNPEFVNGNSRAVTKITNLASFTIVQNTELPGQIGQPTDHPFTVTNTGAVPDIINLTTEDTTPNFTVQIIDPATGEPVPDTNGDNIPDTGTLPPGESRELILRVIPGPGATTDGTTVVRGTSVDTGSTQTVTKITTLQEQGFTITPDTELFTTIGVPARHNFTVTNDSPTVSQVINLTTSGTDPNYTVQIVDQTGQPLTDTDGDGVVDPGSLPPGETAELTLLVTPQAGATTPDTTVITGTNDLGETQSVTKITELARFTIEPDTTLPASIGQTVEHPFTVNNTGDVPDTINLTTEGTDPNYTVQIIDTATGNPPPDTNGDGIPDTGSLPPGQSRQFVLQVTPGPNATDNDTTVVRGTSVDTDSTLTVNKVTTLGNFTLTPDTERLTQIGVPVIHPFEVTNNIGSPDVINLVTGGTDPNYRVQIIDLETGEPVPDTDGDGNPDTGSLPPGTTRNFGLRVLPGPDATVPDQTTITGISTNTSEQQVVTKTTNLAAFNLRQPSELVTTPETPVDHPFTLTNNSTVPDVFTLVPTGTNPNFRVEIIDTTTGEPIPDTDGNGTPDPIPLDPGETREFVLRVTPGPGVTPDIIDNTVVTATSQTTGESLSVTKTTSITVDTTGDITLTKRITRVFRAQTGLVENYDVVNPPSNPEGFVGVTTPTPAELQPGDLVEYTVYFVNPATGRVLNLEICDPIPEESSFVTDPTVVPDFQGLYSSGRGIAYDVPSVLPLGDGGSLSNVFDNDEGEFINPLTPRASCPNENAGNQGAVVVRVGPVGPGEAGFIKFVTRLE